MRRRAAAGEATGPRRRPALRRHIPAPDMNTAAASANDAAAPAANRIPKRRPPTAAATAAFDALSTAAASSTACAATPRSTASKSARNWSATTGGRRPTLISIKADRVAGGHWCALRP